jgi:hypothetical protein
VGAVTVASTATQLTQRVDRRFFIHTSNPGHAGRPELNRQTVTAIESADLLVNPS